METSVDQIRASGAAGGWQQALDEMLPLLGHRNWIVIADKAFPMQNATGMAIINTGEALLPVLSYVLQKIDHSTHVTPVIYKDRELDFVTAAEAPGSDQFLTGFSEVTGSQKINTILHDSIFTKLDEVSKLFRVVVLKTNETIAYSSVFLELDCAYWDAEKEARLRSRMSAGLSGAL